MEFKEITEKMENEIVENLPAGNDILKVEDGFVAIINNVKNTHQFISINLGDIRLTLAEGMELVITEFGLSVYYNKIAVASVESDIIERIRIL